MSDIRVSVENLWKFFHEHRKQLAKEWMLIATNEDENTEVFITECNHYPKFSVEIGNKTEFEEETICRTDAEDTYQRLLRLYILEEEEPTDDPFSESELQRVEDCTEAVKDFISILISEPAETYFDDSDCYSLLSLVEGFLNEYGLYIVLDD